jgi:hypothetical protein
MKRVALSAFAGAALAVFAACSGNKATSPTPTPTVTVSSVTIANTSSTSSPFQLVAMARMSDGATRDVTTAAVWQTSNAALATVSSTGVLTVVGSGEVEVRATYQSVLGTLKILVSRPPAPMAFALSGVVREVPPTLKVVPGTRVEITAGPATGRVAMADDAGIFRFDNLAAGIVSMQATAAGYQLWRITNLSIDRDLVLDVTMYLTPPTDATGASATGRCKDGMWTWAQHRAEACVQNEGLAYGVCPGPLCDGQ